MFATIAQTSGMNFEPPRYRRPRTSDLTALIAVALLMAVLAWFGITPAIMPARE
jgi:hypothetical protein